MNKIYTSASEAIADIREGSSIMIQSFVGASGVPQTLIKQLLEQKTQNLTLIMGSNPAFPGGTTMHKDFREYYAPRDLIISDRVKKVIFAWGKNATSMFPGETQGPWVGKEENMEFEFMPMGVMSHRIRAAGNGMGAFFSPIGAGTWYAEGKESRMIDGREYVLEYPIKADYCFIKASRADTFGNLTYKLGERMWAPLFAKACKRTIVEVDEIVEPGAIPADQVITPGIYVDRIIRSTIKSKEGK